ASFLGWTNVESASPAPATTVQSQPCGNSTEYRRLGSVNRRNPFRCCASGSATIARASAMAAAIRCRTVIRTRDSLAPQQFQPLPRDLLVGVVVGQQAERLLVPFHRIFDALERVELLRVPECHAAFRRHARLEARPGLFGD